MGLSARPACWAIMPSCHHHAASEQWHFVQTLCFECVPGEFCLTGVAGCRSLHYVHGYQLFAGEEGEGKLTNPTVGGTHPSDLGQYDMADFYTKFLPTIIGE